MATGLDKFFTTVEYLRKWLLVPACSVLLLCAKLYVDNHYVDKEHFDKAMIVLSVDKDRYAADQKADLKEINGKLDTLLQGSAANSERFTDAERRLNKAEEKIDRLATRKP